MVEHDTEQKIRQRAGANSTQIVGDYNTIGLDEEAVAKLLTALEQSVSAHIGSSESHITESVHSIVTVAFESYVADIEKAQDDTKAEIEEKIRYKFDELVKNVENFAQSIWSEIKSNNAALGDMSAALSATRDSYSQSAERVLSAIDELKDYLKAGEVTEAAKAIDGLVAAMSGEFIDEDLILACCDRLDRRKPGHFLSRFCRAVCGDNARAIDEVLRSVDVGKDYDYIDDALRFLLKAPRKENLLAINNLIARAYESRDVALFDEFNRLTLSATEKISAGAYDPMIPRDCFIAYKSEDMREVEEVVRYLEERGITCYVAARNLPHGKVSNYDRALEAAMDKCKVFVFISSERSRTVGDARNKELAYILRKDFSRAPEYEARGDYAHLPRDLKKARVEYVIEPYKGTVTEAPVKEFFDGFERVYKNGKKGLEELLGRISEFADPLRNARKPAESKDAAKAAAKEEKERLAAEKKRADEIEKLKKQADEQSRRQEEEIAKLKKQLEKEREKPKKSDDGAAQPAEQGYPTLDRYDKKAFKIRGKTLIKYKGRETEVKIPEGVESIQPDAFLHCVHIMSVVIPKGVKTIGKHAFLNCGKLMNVTVPPGIKSIGYDAFFGCEALIGVYISDIKAWLEIDFEGLGSNPLYYAHNLYLDGKLVTKLEIPYGIPHIGNYAFINCNKFTSLSMSGTVKSIGEYAFYGCTSLANSVYIPESVVHMGSYSFYDCGYLSFGYGGTAGQWQAISKGESWHHRSAKVYCRGGVTINALD